RWAPSLVALFRPGVIDQNPPHHLRGYAKEMSAVLPAHLCLIDQSQVSLVNQRCGLQGVTWALEPQVAIGHATQFLIDSANYVIEGFGVSTVPGNQPLGDLVLSLVDLILRWLFHCASRREVHELACVEPNTEFPNFCRAGCIFYSDLSRYSM